MVFTAQFSHLSEIPHNIIKLKMKNTRFLGLGLNYMVKNPQHISIILTEIVITMILVGMLSFTL